MDNYGKLTLESMSQAGWYNTWLENKVRPFLKGDILEIGCGIGNFTKDLVKFGQVWAMDIDKSYVLKTKENSPLANVGLGNIETGEYFFKDKKFDNIVCINVLEHIKDDKKALLNLYSLLKKNGSLILIVPAHQFLYGEIDRSIDHFRRYTKSKLKKQFKNLNFKTVFCKELNMLGAIGWLVAGKVLKEKTVKKERIFIFNKIGPIYLKLENLFEPPFGISVMIIGTKQ